MHAKQRYGMMAAHPAPGSRHDPAAGSRPLARLWSNALLLVGVAALYAVTVPVNHVEAIDGYAYALAAETGPLSVVHDTRGILFHALNRLLVLAADGLGLHLGGLTIMIVQSLISAVFGVVLMRRLLERGFSLDPRAAWSGAALLAVCYGYWRYAVEAEVNAPSFLLILATLNLAFDAADERPARWTAIVPAAVLAGFSVLYCQHNAIPLLMALPLLLLRRAGWATAASYGAIAGVLVLVGNVAAYAVHTGALPTAGELVGFVANRTGEFPDDPFTIRTLGRIALVLVETVLPTYWVFAFPSLSEPLVHLFPRFGWDASTFAVEAFRPLVYGAAVLLPVLVWLAARIVVVAWRRPTEAGRDDRLGFVGLWLLLVLVIVGYMDPGSNEAWLIVTLPMVVLAAVLLFEPAMRAGAVRTVVALVAVLAAYNYLGGIGLWQSERGDLFKARTAWLAANVKPADMVVIGQRDYRYLSYLGYVLRVEAAEFISPTELETFAVLPVRGTLEEMRSRVRDRGGRLLVMGDFFEPSRSEIIRQSDVGIYEQAVRRAERYGSVGRLLDEGPYGRIYELMPEGP